MIDHIDKRLVFSGSTTGLTFTAKPSPASTAESSALVRISANPTTHWPSNSLASSSKMAAGTARHGPSCRQNALPAGALRSTPPSACSKDCSITNEQGANQPLPRRRASAPKIISSNAACSARFATAKSSTSAGYDSRSRRFGITTSCADSSICGMQESSLTVASVKP